MSVKDERKRVIDIALERIAIQSTPVLDKIKKRIERRYWK